MKTLSEIPASLFIELFLSALTATGLQILAHLIQ